MSKDTARQEVEKVCFAYEKAGKTGDKKEWGKFYDLEEPLIKKVEVANQPKLSIPKKIAEEIQLFLEEYDIEDKALFLIKEYHGAFGTFFSDDFRKWANDPLANNRSAKIIAYINPLTRKLVEVEG